MRAAALLSLAAFDAVAALDNGLAVTPPMGWRSWNFFQGDISDELIRGQVDALLVKRPVRTCDPLCSDEHKSLLDLGFVHAGIDDGWQACGSFTVEPSGAPAFHDAAGKPIVNATKFPDLKALSGYATAKGVSLGWYENNCICHESGGHIRNQTWRELSYAGDVQQLVENDFKGVKFDNCGLHNDMDHYAELMNATGKAFLVERSDQGHGTPTNLSWCPMNLFRSSGDIRPTWTSIHRNLHTTTQYTNISRPGCWAYPDMLQVGNIQGPLAAAESRSHFGAWAVVSSPLILGMDLANESIMAAVWPYISNPEVISVNQAWEGSPGGLVRPADEIAVEVWAKPQPAAGVALLAINTGTAPSATLPLSLAPLLDTSGMCSGKPCTVRDLWGQKDGGVVIKNGVWNVPALGGHDSAFVLITPA